MQTSKYVITGTKRDGSRFKPIYTDTPWHYNIWNGSIWEMHPETRRRTLIKRIYN